MTTTSERRTAPVSPAPDPAEAPVRRRRPDGLATGVSTRLLGLLVLVLLLGVAAIASMALGSRDLAPSLVWQAVWDSASADDGGVVWNSRIPRLLIALIAGLGLGLAGALIQAVTRNPLADPGILGVTAGASFAVGLAVGVFGFSAATQYQWFAYGGALLATVVVYIIGSIGPGSSSPAQLVLAGVALGALLSGIMGAMLLADPEGFNAMRAWEAGSLQGRGWAGIGPVSVAVAVGVVIALALGPALNAVALGDDLARSLGVNVWLVRSLAILAIAALAGGSAALAGPIAFVGLMVPHLARWVTGPDQRWILAYCLVLGPLVLTVSDIVGRLVMRPGELPVGIVTAFLGAPVLIALVRRRRASGL